MMRNYGETLKFSEITGEGEGAGVGTVPEEPSITGESTGATGEPAGITFPENWKEGLPEEIRGEPSLGVINDVVGLAKSYVSSQKMMGADRVVVPGKHATDDDWRGFYNKLGHPDALEKYEINVPEGNNFDDGFVTQLKEVAFNNNIMPKQLDAVLDWYNKANNEAIEVNEKQMENDLADRLDVFKKELGQNYNHEINKATSAFKHFFESDEDLKTWIDDSGLGNEPQFLKMFMKIGDLLAEDKIIGTDPETAGRTGVASQEEVNSILSNPEHPYNDAKHANHQSAVKEVQRMMQQLYPTNA